MAAKKRREKPKPVLTVRVKGPAVRKGRIAIPDLIRISQEVQNSVNKQAEALQGDKTIHPGPVKDNIRKECTLDLIGLGGGSTELYYDFAHPVLPFPKTDHFGLESVRNVGATIKQIAKDPSAELPVDDGVLVSLYNLGNVAEGRRITTLEWIVPENGKPGISAKLTKTVREKLATRLSHPRIRPVQLDGILEMADFKPHDFKCRIFPPLGVAVTCSFDETREETVYRLLRQPVRVNGEGTFQPYTDRLDSMVIKEIAPLPSLALGKGNFFSGDSLAELARKQKVIPMRDVKTLSGAIPKDENVDDFLEGIYSARKSEN